TYQAAPRMGGEAGFKRLVTEAQRLGFKIMPMFGANAANRKLPNFSNFADGATARIDGDPFDLNWVDWDNDRHQEGFGVYMNLGVESWRRGSCRRRTPPDGGRCPDRKSTRLNSS